MRLALLTLPLVGCTGLQEQSFPVDLYVDSRFSDAEVSIIDTALTEWHEATGGIVEINPIYGYETDCDLLSVYGDVNKVLHYCTSSDEFTVIVKPDPHIVGVADWQYVALIVDRMGGSPWLLHAVTLHELGHFVGLPHHEVEGCLMHPLINHTQGCIDDVTVADFCDHYDCNGSEHAMCK